MYLRKGKPGFSSFSTKLFYLFTDINSNFGVFGFKLWFNFNLGGLYFAKNFNYKKYRVDAQKFIPEKFDLAEFSPRELKNIEESSTYFCLKAKDFGKINSKEIIAAYRCMSNTLKTIGRIWVNVYPQYLKGKSMKDQPNFFDTTNGKVKFWDKFLLPNEVLFELTDVPKDLAFLALNLARNCLSVETVMLMGAEHKAPVPKDLVKI